MSFVETSDVSSKTSGEVWDAIGKDPVQINVWGEDFFDKALKIFKIIDNLNSVGDSVAPDMKRYFLAVDYRASDP